MKSTNISIHIQHFLQDYLSLQKGFSRNTVLSYRDTIKLFLVFSAERKKKAVTRLILSDLTPSMATDFLDYLEKKRGNTRQTRNVRLACLHSLFRYLAKQDPLFIGQCQRILAIPFKQTTSTTVEYLEREEIRAVLDAVDPTDVDGLRDHALLSFMYNTGARVQETVNLTTKSFQLERPFQVLFFGKGAKERLCPLWPETVKALRALFKARDLTPQANSPVFVNHKGQVLTRHGIRYLLNKYVDLASAKCPSLKKKNIHPHSIRHTTGMHLLQSGVDINTIRAWLGHTNLETTNRYAEINLEMKRKVLEKYLPNHKTDQPWKQNQDLLQWLESL
jgi:site-specific recombinase XerD